MTKKHTYTHATPEMIDCLNSIRHEGRVNMFHAWKPLMEVFNVDEAAARLVVKDWMTGYVKDNP